MPKSRAEIQRDYRERMGREEVNKRQRERRKKKTALQKREKRRKTEQKEGRCSVGATEILRRLHEHIDRAEKEAEANGTRVPRRPKDGTLAMYVRSLDDLHTAMYGSTRRMCGLLWLKDYAKVTNMIDILYKGRTLASKCGMASAISAVLRRLPLEYDRRVYELYRTYNMALCDQRQNQVNMNRLEEGRGYVLSWGKLMDIVEPALKYGLGTPRDRMVVRMFTLIPPRRCMDYQLLRVGYNTQSTKDYNWLDLEKGRIIFNRFKTDKVYGTQIFDLPDDLLEYLRQYCKKKVFGDFVFESSPGLYYTSFSTIVRKAFLSLTGPLNELGQGMTANDLRHSYITWWLTCGDRVRSVAERDDIAKKMAHSRSMQDQYLKLDLISY